MKQFQDRSFLLIILFSFLTSPSVARDTITPTQPLLDNQTLISSGENFALGFFTPAGSSNRYIGIWYNKITVQTIVWVANRNNPVVNSTATLSVTTDGRLVIADQSSTIVWSTPATSLTSPVAQLLDNGNLVVIDETSTSSPSSFAWQGFDYPTDTQIPGMKVGLDLARGLSRNLTAWKSDGDPSPSSYYSSFDISGDPEMFLWKGSAKVWRSGPWDGLGFSGAPDTRTYQDFIFTYINNESEVSYSFAVTNQSIITRLIVNQSGITQRAFWVPETSQWNFFWYAPRDPCDSVNKCGPYGTCSPTDLPICECLQGFTPKNPTNWQLRDGTDGCVRRTALDCRNGTDGFVTVRNAKVPDTTNSTVDLSLDLQQCRALCLRNCSCKAYASANVSGKGSGCVIWVTDLTDIKLFANSLSGQDLYLRLAAADLGSAVGQSHKNGLATVAIVVSIVAVVLLLGIFGCLLRRRIKKRAMTFGGTPHSFNDIPGENQDDLELPLFDFATIAAATDNFSLINKLGEGGFGPVYKGKLGEDQDIAVKRLAKSSVQGINEFKNEVMLIAKLQHRNLVRLLGCCIQGEERMLIYEYMPNKSLDAFIFEKEKAVTLSWQTRYEIILGIARGILYLHHDSRFRIIHRDLKASNILLDKNMIPKISDFGMARIFGGDEAKVTRRVVGTYGYMAPEYAMDGVFSVKSDVFSFGVLLLEIISGKRNRRVYATSPNTNLVVNAWNLWNQGNGLQIVDELMSYPYPSNEVLKCIKIGLLCVQEWPEDRPLMSSVALMLGSDDAFCPEPKEPGFVARRAALEVDSSSSKPYSFNEISVTIFEGR